MRVPFELKEFLIEPTEEIPVEIADKIYKHHIIPMIFIRQKLGFGMWASQRSGYRSREYELERGRSGDSQHTFQKKGAVDWTCSDFKKNKGLFLNELIKNTPYTRIAVYEGFIHCDYKSEDARQLFTSDENSKWTFVKNLEK